MYSYPLSNVSDRVEDDGYFAFCKIKFEVKPEFSGTTQEQLLKLESVYHIMLMLSGSGGISLGSQVSETLILSLIEHVESSSTLSNIRYIFLDFVIMSYLKIK